MDVSCERCKSEYEFDDSLLGEHGTTVKCSSCNHVFRVMPPARQPSRPSLKVRTVATGQIEPLSSLRDLQRRIHAGEVSADDELGRDGFPWRKLNEVPELRSFFHKPSVPSAARPNATSRGPSAAHQSATASRGAAAISVSQSSMPAPPRDPNPNPKRTMIGVGPQTPQIPGPPRVPNLAGPGPGTKPAAAASPALSATSSRAGAMHSGNAASDSDAPTDPPPGNRSAQPRSLPPLSAPMPSNPVAKLYLADDEAPPARATESASRIWLIAGIAGVVLLGGIVVVGAMSGKSETPETPPPARVEAVPAQPEAVPEAPPVPTPAVPAAPASGKTAPAATAKTEPAPQPTAPSEPAAAVAAPEAEDTDSKGSRDKPARDINTADAKDYTGLVAQGDAAMVRGDAAAAQKSYEAAIAMRASGSEAITGLGYAMLSEGKGREALSYFERAARNGYAEASIGIGDAHKKLGDFDAARKAYKSYLDRMPGGSRASYVKKQLDGLKATGAPEPAGEETAPAPSGQDEYRPAGELVEPPAPAKPAEPEPEPAGEATP